MLTFVPRAQERSSRKSRIGAAQEGLEGLVSPPSEHTATITLVTPLPITSNPPRGIALEAPFYFAIPVSRLKM